MRAGVSVCAEDVLCEHGSAEGGGGAPEAFERYRTKLGRYERQGGGVSS